MKSKCFFMALTILTTLVGCQSRDAIEVPSDIAGAWVTFAPKYKDCSFELNKRFIIFTNGDLLENIDVNFISKVEKTADDIRTSYNIYYKDLEGNKFKLSFYFDPSIGGTIRFKNQQDIEWKRNTCAKL